MSRSKSCFTGSVFLNGFSLAENDRLRSVCPGPARRAVDANAGTAGGREPSVLPAVESDSGGQAVDKYVEAICERFYAGDVGRRMYALAI